MYTKDVKREKAIKILLTGLLFCFVFTFQGCSSAKWPVPSERVWYDGSWLYRQQITISSSMAPSDQSDFPVLIKITNQNNPVFANAQSNGDDILFTSSDGTTRLDHEIEYYSSLATKELDAWVRIPSLSSSSDTVIYMYYSNSSVSNQENVAGVWDSNFTLVQHLQETSGTHLDSTSNNNDSISIDVTAQGTATGQINGADEFVGASLNDVTLPMLRNLIDNFMTDGDATDDHGTIEVWMYPTGSPESNDNVVALPPAWSDNWQQGGVFRGIYPIGGNDRIWVVSGWSPKAILSTDYNVDEWVYIAWVYTDDGVLHGYKNGIEFGSTSAVEATAGYLHIGSTNSWAAPGYFTGNIDELRTSDIARSGDWLLTSFNNQSNPAGFLTFAAEEVY
ncbi:MAG TPA: DUF2341 domain-containing protein [Nitrospirae bacterium]|nr:hypothetical protein BMS3Abin10_00345 [bacterium BMS3Abin10]GBE40105.1 hypothetical protein BMS3Bbin08_02743 [bacterium BMS3Bbin08]HDH50764.1 DUF2341 domain-containing protein [Nitrospirota bacterium]HDZ84542.1 DUF2341 domain-containing protein [Nitrospirota bacterium]